MFQFYFNKVFQFLNHDIYFPLSLIFLVILTKIYFSKTEEEKKAKSYFLILILVLVFFILWSAFLSTVQYFLWKNHPISKYLLPPYQEIDYFLNYAYFRFWRDFFYRILGILFILLFFKFLNFSFKRDIFYKDEKNLIPILSIFFFFPYNILFMVLGFFMLLLITTMKIYRKKTDLNKYFSFRNYWLALAWVLFLIAPVVLSNYKFLQFKP